MSLQAHEITSEIPASTLHVVVIVSRWNELVTKELLEGALDELKGLGVTNVDVVRVPGAWEIPVIAAHALRLADAVIALGCIIQGETKHGELLSNDVSSALMNLQIQYQKPIGWGVLTPEDSMQALERAGLKMGNKGREAASAAVSTALMAKTLDQVIA